MDKQTDNKNRQQLTDDEIWDLILQYKGLIYKTIYRYTYKNVDEIYQEVVLELFCRLRRSNNTYLPVQYVVLNALRKVNKYSKKEVYVDRETLDVIGAGGVAVC